VPEGSRTGETASFLLRAAAGLSFSAAIIRRGADQLPRRRCLWLADLGDDLIPVRNEGASFVL